MFLVRNAGFMLRSRLLMILPI